MKFFFIIKKLKKHQLAIITGFGCIILGMLAGSYTSINDYAWYDKLHQPNFTPPKLLFAPIWTILYFMIGIAFNKIWQAKQTKLLRKFTIIILILHFISNLIWTYIFFSMRRIDIALYDIAFIWVSLITLIIITRKIKSVFLWLLPYLAWVSFALILNFAVYQLN